MPFLGGSYPTYFDKNPYLTTKIQSTYKEEFSKTENKFGSFYPAGKNRTVSFTKKIVSLTTQIKHVHFKFYLLKFHIKVSCDRTFDLTNIWI